jgi:hypothetical protein
VAWAKSGYLNTFNTKYGTSGTRLDDCMVCHVSGSNSRNVYGRAFGTALSANNATVQSALTAIEGQDSDGDHATNILEINARTLPGDSQDVVHRDGRAGRPSRHVIAEANEPTRPWIRASLSSWRRLRGRQSSRATRIGRRVHDRGGREPRKTGNERTCSRFLFLQLSCGVEELAGGRASVLPNHGRMPSCRGSATRVRQRAPIPG